MLPNAEDEAATVTAFLQARFAADAAGVQRLAGGMFSRAFAFTAQGQAYVVRLSTAVHAAESFAKDDYAGRHFGSADLPIPRTLAWGQAADGWFSITERAAGRSMQEYPPEQRRALLPATLDALDAVARADVRASHGYGPWAGDGHGRYASWRDYLAAVIDDESDGYYQNWHDLFRDTFLEREVYETVYRHMLRLVDHCPEERALIHNDYWFENIVSDGERITAVIDWANALYGDPLYDVARLGWGAYWPGWWHDDGAAVLRARYSAMPGFAERIACYECHLALDDLRFYAKTGRRAEYDWARERLLARVSTTKAGG